MIILPREILSSIFQNVPIFFYSIQRNTLTNMEKVITHFQFFFSRMYSFSFSLFCYSICYNIDISKDKKYVMERKFKPGVDCYDSVCIITKKWRYRDSKNNNVRCIEIISVVIWNNNCIDRSTWNNWKWTENYYEENDGTFISLGN